MCLVWAGLALVHLCDLYERVLVTRKLLILGLLAAPVITAQSVDIPFYNGDGNNIRVDLVIESKTRRMTFDTGATTTSFRKVIGQRGQPVVIDTASGEAIAFRCTVQVDVPNMKQVTLEATCGLNNLPDGEDGLLGEDFMRKFKTVQIDYEHKVIRLE